MKCISEKYEISCSSVLLEQHHLLPSCLKQNGDGLLPNICCYIQNIADLLKPELALPSKPKGHRGKNVEFVKTSL